MGKKDPHVDAYIAKAAPFAQPILTYIREAAHSASPDIGEDMKWSHPHFVYKGMIAGMAAFKAHCAFGFWKGKLVVDDPGEGTEAMGQFGRIATVKDLPPKKVLSGYVKKAMKLNDEGVPSPMQSKPKTPKPPFVVPRDLAAALKANKKALATFGGFPPSAQREYVEWITEAKTDATRTKRLATAVEWIAEGKRRMWKYGA